MPSGNNHFALFMSIRRQILLRRLASGWKDARKSLERGSTLLIILALVAGSYLLFHTVFHYLLGLPQIGRLILERIFQLGWNAIFFLLIVSNIVTAFSTLYRSDEVKFLLTSPLDFRSIFQAKAIDNLMYSSWALVLLGAPILTAYMHQLGVLWVWWLPIILVGLTGFMTIAAVFALLILLVLLRIAHRSSLRIAFLGLGVIVFGGLGAYFFLFNPPSLVVSGPATFGTLNQYVLKLGSQPFLFSPTYWLQRFIISFANSEWSTATMYGGLLLTTGLAGWQVLLSVAKRWWYRTWQVLATGDREKQQRYVPQMAKPVRWYWRWMPPQIRALFVKDVVQFWRLPNQWAQFLLMFLFLLIYLANLFNIAAQFNLNEPFWKTLIFFINFGFSGFIIAAMISRYIYPLISLEGPGFWILRSSPIKIRTIFRQKFLLSIVIFLVIAEMIVVISNIVLEISTPLMLLAAGSLIIMSIALSAIAIGFGARFPEFHETNPMKIASTAGGFITVISCLVYVALVNTIMALPTYQYFQFLSHNAVFPTRGILIAALLLIVLNILAIWFPLRIGERHLYRIEV